MTVVSTDELRRAWHAVQAGQFRAVPGQRRAVGTHPGDKKTSWTPPAPIVPVLGCHGSAGATTVAVAVATALEPLVVRVVEAAPAGASGLAGFATAELGPTGTGWLRGHRSHIVIDRIEGDPATPDHLPVPDADTPEQPKVNLLDVSWPAHTALGYPGWLQDALEDAEHLVLVTTATVPGLRRLELLLHDLRADPAALTVAVHGPRRRRWPREVSHCVGPLTQTLLQEALVEVPVDHGLAVRGLDTSPLPATVLAAAAQITERLPLTSPANHHPKGHTHAQ